MLSYNANQFYIQATPPPYPGYPVRNLRGKSKELPSVICDPILSRDSARRLQEIVKEITHAVHNPNRSDNLNFRLLRALQDISEMVVAPTSKSEARQIEDDGILDVSLGEKRLRDSALEREWDGF